MRRTIQIKNASSPPSGTKKNSPKTKPYLFPSIASSLKPIISIKYPSPPQSILGLVSLNSTWKLYLNQLTLPTAGFKKYTPCPPLSRRSVANVWLALKEDGSRISYDSTSWFMIKCRNINRAVSSFKKCQAVSNSFQICQSTIRMP